MANKIALQDEDYGGAYDPSDSEDNYSDDEKKLLKKVRQGRGKKQDSKQELLRFDESADESEKDEIMDESDIGEDDEYDDIPDSKAWGNKRKLYYNTDFVDQDYSTFNEQEEEQAQQEEEEAKAIQQRLAKQLDEADFFLDSFEDDTKNASESVAIEKTTLKADFSDMSSRQKLQLFYKDSPEFAGLVRDYELYLEESEKVLSPVISYAASRDLQLPVIDFIQTRNNIILSYCTNISFYLLLKAKRISIKNHPITKRLVQLRKLLLQLQEKYENVVRPQLDIILEAIETGNDLEIEDGQKKPNKKLNILKSFGEETAAGEDLASEDDDVDEPSSKKVKMDSETDSDEEKQDTEGEDLEDGEDAERRGITYQISKNKGIMPYRKKELRNPRVKHRNKFRKANIRRKGAVRTVRKESKRYGGEMSGIKSTVKKGIKIKS